MLAWVEYKATLCPGCGHPKTTAWHPDNDGWFDVDKTRVTCHACTAIKYPDGQDAKSQPVEYLAAVYTRAPDQPLPPMPERATPPG